MISALTLFQLSLVFVCFCYSFPVNKPGLLMERKALWRIFDGCILKIHACVQYKKREEKKNIDFSLAPTLDPNLGQPRNFCLLFLELKKWCFPKAASTRVRYLHHSLSELGVLALLHTPQPQPLLDYYQYSLTTLPPVRTYFIMSSPATSPPTTNVRFSHCLFVHLFQN